MLESRDLFFEGDRVTFMEISFQHLSPCLSVWSGHLRGNSQRQDLELDIFNDRYINWLQNQNPELKLILQTFEMRVRLIEKIRSTSKQC